MTKKCSDETKCVYFTTSGQFEWCETHKCMIKVCESKSELKAEVSGEIDELLIWCNREQKNNNIYRKDTEELNEDFIEKLEKLKQRVEKI